MSVAVFFERSPYSLNGWNLRMQNPSLLQFFILSVMWLLKYFDFWEKNYCRSDSNSTVTTRKTCVELVISWEISTFQEFSAKQENSGCVQKQKNEKASVFRLHPLSLKVQNLASTSKSVKKICWYKNVGRIAYSRPQVESVFLSRENLPAFLINPKI